MSVDCYFSTILNWLWGQAEGNLIAIISMVASVSMAVIFYKLLPLHKENLRLARLSREHDLWVIRYDLYLKILEFWEESKWTIEYTEAEKKFISQPDTHDIATKLGGMSGRWGSLILMAKHVYLKRKKDLMQKADMIFGGEVKWIMKDCLTDQEREYAGLFPQSYKDALEGLCPNGLPEGMEVTDRKYKIRDLRDHFINILTIE